MVRAGEELLPVLLEYVDAQFELTGIGYPLGILMELEDEEVDEGDAEEWPVEGISVLQRHDYVVTDEDAVLAAGRQAYLQAWPEDDEAAAAADVNHVGRALYQVAHAEGWGSLRKVPGLAPVGGFTGVVRQDELLGPDPDDWAAEVLDEDAELLYCQEDVFRAP
ncbi:hypothetical protein EFK50_01705 [Nocardioides marmoriginsengisoli]|uniref:Uncharacterized protein n=1 Tax=Nocardioides marmoriginsengisoli TaxID=661483 RepID=A0A3N0CQQ3_9ACTN|nr:hypothetical protein EFK50_01705 [Nocardioides marmoriginsengisoli]